MEFAIEYDQWELKFGEEGNIYHRLGLEAQAISLNSHWFLILERMNNSMKNETCVIEALNMSPGMYISF